MAAPKSSAADINRWHAIISEGESSDMSAKEYCDKLNINPKTYSAWKKRLVELGKKLPDATPQGKAKARAPRGRSAGKAESQAKVSSIAPNFGKSSRPKVDYENMTISATLPNGVLIELSCPSEAELRSALKTLSSL